MIPGERFELDLEPEHENLENSTTAAAPFNFLADIAERKPSAPKPPSAPSPKNADGFPQHKKRFVTSRFKKQQQQQSSSPPTPAQTQPSVKCNTVSNASPRHGNRDESSKPKDWLAEERARIDVENSQMLAGMSTADIEQERAELLSSLSPALVQRLLARSNIDSGSNESILTGSDDLNHPHDTLHQKATPRRTVAFQEPEIDPKTQERNGNNHHQENIHDHDEDTTAQASVMHFPKPHQPPSLDPNSATFFNDLHEKYFPSLPSDPQKLDWMRNSTLTKNPYDPSASTLNPNEIRFAFSGQLIPPRSAAEIPVTEGLHHHGDAPDAAGYTIPELSHLSRSSYPAQRCIAFQTLGRVLYRLGAGEFGDPGEPGANTVGAEDTFGELARGLWREVEMHQVVENLVTESEGKGVDKGRHVSARAYATEALWLWRKGGGRRWKAA